MIALSSSHLIRALPLALQSIGVCMAPVATVMRMGTVNLKDILQILYGPYVLT